MKKFILLISMGISLYAGAQTCQVDIDLSNESITRALRYLHIFGDKKKALKEASDAIKWGKEAVVDCTKSPRHAKAQYKKALSVQVKILNYETEEEHMQRIMKERGLD